MNKAKLAWAAGLVDGEGCVHGTKNGTITLSISMCDAQCLWRFRSLFDGCSISPWIHREGGTAFRRVSLSGKNALNAIKQMRPWLSSVKLADFAYAMTVAPNAGKGANWARKSRTHCPKGHPYSKHNTYWYTGPHGRQRICRACRRDVNERWYERNKHTRFWMKYR